MIWIKVSESFFPGDTGKSINGWKGVILGRRCLWPRAEVMDDTRI